MYNGKAVQGDGGAIFASVSSIAVPASITFSSCNTLLDLFEAVAGNGGFFYVDNPDLSLVSAGCKWQDLWAKAKWRPNLWWSTIIIFALCLFSLKHSRATWMDHSSIRSQRLLHSKFQLAIYIAKQFQV